MKKLIPCLTVLFATLFTLTSYAQQQGLKQTSLHFVIDNSGSMKNDFDWIIDSMTAIDKEFKSFPALTHSINLYGFSNKVQLLAQGDMSTIKAAIGSVRRGKGNEDGILAINEIIDQSNIENGHIILFTDEPRSIVQPIELNELNEAIKEQNVTVHVIVANSIIEFGQQISGKRGDNIAVTDQQQFKELLSGLSKTRITQFNEEKFQQMCERTMQKTKPAVVQRACLPNQGQEQGQGQGQEQKPNRYKQSWLKRLMQFEDHYIDLALQSGGTAWNMSGVRTNQQIFSQFLSLAMTGESQLTNGYQRQYSSQVKVIGDPINNQIKVNQSISFEINQDNQLLQQALAENWQWDFDGDGNIDDHGPHVSYTFTQSGIHHVKLWTEFGGENPHKKIQIVRVMVLQPENQNQY